MASGVFIVGTGTDVGKTIVTAGLMHVLTSNGYNATYFKAALSGAIVENNELIPGDTKLVSDVGNLTEDYQNITPYIYETAVSPHLAAKLENNPIDLDVIKAKYDYIKEKYDYIIAEGSGGIVCPLIDDETGIYTIADLIKDLNMSVIVVATAGLGTINHTLLTVKYLEMVDIKVEGIIINDYRQDMLCDNNIEMIEKLTNLPIIAKLNHIENLQEDMVAAIRKNAENAFNIENIVNCMEELR